MNTALIKAGGIGIGVALVLVAIAHVAADAMSGPLLVTPPGGSAVEDVAIGLALMSTVVGGVAGIGLALVAQRFGRPKATFVAVCVVALVLYGTVPFTAAEETTTAVWLNVMHVLAALPIVGLLARQLPVARARTERSQAESESTGATS
jgi:hypothetical protein